MNDKTDQDAFSALRALDQWDWQRTTAADALAFDEAIEECWPFLSARAPEPEEQTRSALRSLYERSNHRLGTFLRDFGDRLRAADDARQQVLLDEAIRWSENQYERSVLISCFQHERTMKTSGLTDDRLTVDELIEKIATARWQKVAMIVGTIMKIRSDSIDEAIAERVRVLVDNGVLEAQGDLSNMRSSEVRLPPSR